MVFEGVFTWFMLSSAACRWRRCLGLVTGVLAFIPNIGAITSGVLMVAVGFSAGPNQGLWAIFVYFFVQNIDGYLVVPYIARRTVDLPPGAGAGDAAADGRSVRDSRRAVRRSDPRDDEGGAGRLSASGRRRRRAKRAGKVVDGGSPDVRLLLPCAQLLRRAPAASARRWARASRHGCRSRGWRRAGSVRRRAAHGRSRAWTGYGPCNGRLPASAIKRLRRSPGMVWLASTGTGPLPALESNTFPSSRRPSYSISTPSWA